MISPLELFDLFNPIDWCDPKDCEWLEHYQTDILLEQDSLSHRLLSYCEHFEAQVVASEWKNLDQLPDWLKGETDTAIKKAIEHEGFLLRDVVLLADKSPWALGRSFIPKSTAKQAGFDLENQGETPLGFTLFQGNNIERDPIKIAQIKHNEQMLVARMSRLKINHKPLIVMELFLPAAPVYKTNQKERH